MLQKALIIVLAALVSFGVIGCSKKPKEEPAAKPAAKPPVRAVVDYKAEAKKAITKENMQGELDKIEKEVDADK